MPFINFEEIRKAPKTTAAAALACLAMVGCIANGAPVSDLGNKVESASNAVEAEQLATPEIPYTSSPEPSSVVSVGEQYKRDILAATPGLLAREAMGLIPANDLYEYRTRVCAALDGSLGVLTLEDLKSILSDGIQRGSAGFDAKKADNMAEGVITGTIRSGACDQAGQPVAEPVSYTADAEPVAQYTEQTSEQTSVQSPIGEITWDDICFEEEPCGDDATGIMWWHVGATRPVNSVHADFSPWRTDLNVSGECYGTEPVCVDPVSGLLYSFYGKTYLYANPPAIAEFLENN